MLGTIMAGERLLRDHPEPLEARPGEGGGRGAGSGLEREGQAAVGAQQLLHAAGRLRDALEPLPVHLRARPRLADPRRPDGARRADPPLLQPPAHAAGTPGGSSRRRRAGLLALAIAIRPPSSSSNVSGPVPSFATVQAIVANRCAPCHSLHPTSPATPRRRRGSSLETPEQIRAAAALIKTVAVDSKAMPLGNATRMTQAERDTLARWLASR